MGFPNFAGKQGMDAYINPTQAVSYLQRAHAPWLGNMPEAVIFCHQGTLLGYIAETEDVAALENPACELFLLTRTGGRVGVATSFGIGAPAATTVMEELIALGVRRFINLGRPADCSRTWN